MIIRKIFAGFFIILVMVMAMLVSLPGSEQEQLELEPEPIPTLDELIPQGKRADSDLMLRVLDNGAIVKMSMERYLIGVVAAEMPVTFELEALMAQAVAARTNALYNTYIRPKSNHPGADVCTDSSCCTAYIGDEQLHGKWGEDYVENITRTINAVLRTDGEYISYEDKPILAVFHSSSAGKTEASGDVWMTDLPYLVSVYSPETQENVPGFVSTVSVPRAELTETILSEYPDADFGGNKESWITDITYTESGRINDLIIAGVTIKGTELRSIFALRSTAIEFEWVDEDLVITTTGFGHGVGMSQYGANIMANNGLKYKQILNAYYPDTVIEQLGDMEVIAWDAENPEEEDLEDEDPEDADMEGEDEDDIDDEDEDIGDAGTEEQQDEGAGNDGQQDGGAGTEEHNNGDQGTEEQENENTEDENPAN